MTELKKNTYRPWKSVNYSMVSTSVSYVLVASPPAPVTGGIPKTIWVLLSSCKPTDGLSTLVINTLTNALKSSEET